MDILLLLLRILLAVLLYGFLSAILITLWRDLKQTTTSQEIARPHGELVLISVPAEGDDTPETGTRYTLQALTSLGRQPNNIVPVIDEYASGQHALLSWKEEQWWLEDCKSRNGTYLNGTRVTAPTVVSAGDTIRIGRTEYKLELP